MHGISYSSASLLMFCVSVGRLIWWMNIKFFCLFGLVNWLFDHYGLFSLLYKALDIIFILYDFNITIPAIAVLFELPFSWAFSSTLFLTLMCHFNVCLLLIVYSYIFPFHLFSAFIKEFLFLYLFLILKYFSIVLPFNFMPLFLFLHISSFPLLMDYFLLFHYCCLFFFIFHSVSSKFPRFYEVSNVEFNIIKQNQNYLTIIVPPKVPSYCYIHKCSI